MGSEMESLGDNKTQELTTHDSSTGAVLGDLYVTYSCPECEEMMNFSVNGITTQNITNAGYSIPSGDILTDSSLNSWNDGWFYDTMYYDDFAKIAVEATVWEYEPMSSNDNIYVSYWGLDSTQCGNSITR